MRAPALLTVLFPILGVLLALSGCAPMAGEGISSSSQQADAQRRADIRLQLASAYFAEGQYSTALKELEQAYQTGQRRADVLGLKALVLMQQGDQAGASRTLSQALQAEPDNPGLLNNMGWLLCETGRSDEGLTYIRRALADRSYAYPAKALVNAGRCSVRAGRSQEAAGFFRQAIAIDPAQTIAHASLARLAYEAGDYARAKTHMLQVLAGEHAAKDDYLMAMSIERKLGDAVAEQSLARQWRKKFPGAADAGGSFIDDADDR